MNRLFGTHNKGTHAKAVDADSEGSAPSICDRLIFFVRIGILIAAIVTGALIASPAHSLLINNHCYATAHISTNHNNNNNNNHNASPHPLPPIGVGSAPELQPFTVSFDSDMACVALRMWGVATATFAGVLLLVCLYNVHAVRLRAQTGWMAKLELLLKVLVAVSAGLITGFACARAHTICKTVTDQTSIDSCPDALHLLDTASPMLCNVCGQDGLFEGVVKTLDNVRNCAFASMLAWLLLLVVAVVRHIRAKQRMAALERARALDEEEMRREFERRKEAEKKIKEAGQGEGKGFVYRMLM